MFKLKGWVHRYAEMSREQIRAELRRIGRAGYIYDREEKIAYLRGLSYGIR
jgi:DNA-binding IclR family transcriptional regulator